MHLKTLTFFLILLLPATARAGIGEFIAAAEGDPTLDMLSQLFGEVPGVLEGNTSPLSEMFMIFNMAVFTVAVVMVLYGVVSGIMHTAHSGEIFGGKTTIWYPLRVVYGLFGLMPIFGGWTLPQILMITLMTLGVGVADKTWDIGWRFLLSNVDHLIVANPSSAGRDDAIQAIMAAQMCSLAHNELQSEELQVSGKPAVLFSPAGDLRKIEGGWFKLGFSGISMTWGSDAAGYNPDDCGGVRIKSTDIMVSEIGLPHGSAATRPGYSAEDVERAHSTALQNMSAALLPLSQALYFDGQIPSKSDLARIRINYMSSMAGALAGAAQGAESGFAEYMEDIGRSWLYAGALFAKIVDVNREVMSAAKIPIEVVAPRYEDTPPGLSPALPASGGKEGLAKFEGLKDKIGENLSSKKLDLTSFVSNSMGTDLVKNTMDAITWGSGDTLLGIINMGYTILDAAWGAYSAGLLASGLVELIPGSPTATIGMVLLTFASIIAPLILAGVIFAFIVPFLPTILWYGGILSYGIICVEAVCGAPLWMLAHLETEGEGFGSRAAHGLLFLLNVLFRPVLMTIGLVSGWLLCNLMGEFLKYLLSILYGSSSYGFSGIASIFTYIASVCVMASLMMMTVSKSFSLIHHLPNEVLAWAGGHIGRIGGGEDDSARHFIAGGAGAYSNAAGKGMQGKIDERRKSATNRNKIKNLEGDPS
jgi:conjugal transfer/type IV secretion protein DotA/TraY